MKWLSKKCIFISCLITITLMLGLSLLAMQSARANSTSPVNATIKISICGNGVAEGGEDCDNADLNGQSCQSLGYGGGILSCDISCSFDTSQCSAATSAPTSTSTIASKPTPITTTISKLRSTAAIQPQSFLPQALQVFDIAGAGKLTLTELPNIVRMWVDEWKSELAEEIALEKEGKPTNLGHKNCDINGDGRCDVKDFSILMYYIQR